jgi:hypothetical protein
MAQSGRLAAVVAGAAGVTLSVFAVGLANLPQRDLDALRLNAKKKPGDIALALGLKDPVNLAAAFCFDPLNPPSLETMALINRIMEENAPDYQLGSGTWPGFPGGTLTWSFVPDGTQVPNLSNSYGPSTLFSSMDSKFGNNRALWVSKFQQVFDRWEAITGMKYMRVGNNGAEWDDGASFPNAGASSTPGATRGAVRIAMRTLDGAGGVLAFNYYPTTGDMVIDSAESWQSSSGDYRFLRNTVSHEHGHGLGLAHCCPMNNSKLMEPALSTSFDGPQQDDIRGGHAKYGDFYEPNNTSAQAADLGTIPFGNTVNPSSITGPAVTNATKTSIHNLSDQDWYKFTVTGAASINVTMTPRGSTYLNGPQNTNGSCSAGTSHNSLTQGNVHLAVIGTNGSTVLQQAAAQPAGTAETITGLILPAAGTYFIRVNASSLSTVQLYELTLQVNSGNACPTFTQQPIGQQVCVGSPLVLSVNVSGAPTPTLQWTKDGQPIQGATSSTYSVASATAQTAGTYVCVATNNCGTTPSSPAIVTVPGEISVTQQPQSQTVNVGSPVAFTVAATGTDLSYQWFKGPQPIIGATGAMYQIASAQLGDAGSYRCQIYHNCEATFSNFATLTVEEPTSCYANCDGSTAQPILNVADFTCFLTKFAALDPYANCDGSTTPPVHNVADFTCFLTKFAAGCP